MTSWQNAAVESPRPLQIAVTAITMPAPAQKSVGGGFKQSRQIIDRSGGTSWNERGDNQHGTQIAA